MPNRQEVYVVMEPAATDLIEKVWGLGHIPVDQAKVWFSQILSAVEYLHQNDIAHRDLKCSNVLLTSDGQIKLADFGFGCFSKGYPELRSTICGNSYHASPEMLTGKMYDPKKVDVWSLGVLFFDMVTGSLPYYTSRKSEIPDLQCKPINYPANVTVDEPCKDFISYMLQYNPYLRPSVKEVAQHPFLQPAQENTVSSDTEGNTGTPMCENEECSRSAQDINPLQEDHNSESDKSCQSKEVKVEGYSYFSCSPFCAAVERAAKAHVVAPVIRASQSIQRKTRKLFRRTTSVHDSSFAPQQGLCHSDATTEAPPCSLCSEQRHKDGTPCAQLHEPEVESETVEAQPTTQKRSWRLKFPKFKILKKKNRVKPLEMTSIAPWNSNGLAGFHSEGKPCFMVLWWKHSLRSHSPQ